MNTNSDLLAFSETVHLTNISRSYSRHSKERLLYYVAQVFQGSGLVRLHGVTTVWRMPETITGAVQKLHVCICPSFSDSFT